MQSKDYPVPRKPDDDRLFKNAPPGLKRLQSQARAELRKRARSTYKIKYGLNRPTD